MPHPDLTPELLEEIATILREDVARMERRLAHVQSEGVVELDQSSVGRLSRMDALMNQGLAQASDARAVRELAWAREALEQLAAGSYGICRTCGGPIPVARLMATPEAQNCQRCG